MNAFVQELEAAFVRNGYVEMSEEGLVQQEAQTRIRPSLLPNRTWATWKCFYKYEQVGNAIQHEWFVREGNVLIARFLLETEYGCNMSVMFPLTISHEDLQFRKVYLTEVNPQLLPGAFFELNLVEANANFVIYKDRESGKTITLPTFHLYGRKNA